MAPVEGRNEVPDSEDEPMTSSPANVSDGIADKLFAMAHVPPQDAQDAPREATRPHQANTEAVANLTAQRTGGLDADQSVASINVDAPKDEQTDFQPPTTTAAPSKATNEGSNNAATDLHPYIAPHFSSEIDNMNLRQHATISDSTQNKQHVPVSALTAEAETVTNLGQQQSSNIARDAIQDEVTTPKQQPETVDNEVAPERARKQSSCRQSNVSGIISEQEGELAPQKVEADLPQQRSNADNEVSEVRSDGQSVSQEDANTLVNFQHDTPSLPAPPVSTDCVTSSDGKSSQRVDKSARLMQLEVMQSIESHISSSGSEAKHGVISEDVYDNTNDVAVGLHTEAHGQNKGTGTENETQLDPTMSLASSSRADIESHGERKASKDTSENHIEDRAFTSKNIEPQNSGTASVSWGLSQKATSLDPSMYFLTMPSGSKGESQTSDQEITAPSSLPTAESINAPTAHTSAQQTSSEPNGADPETSNATVSNHVRQNAKAVPERSTATSEPVFDPQTSAHPQPPQTCPAPTPAKTPQEITLAELKAQRSAMLASLAALPAIQVLMEENASADTEMADGDDEPTETDIMAAANKIVKDHIKLLHEYNELKDVGQGLMGLIADQRGVRIIEVQEEFGIETQD